MPKLQYISPESISAHYAELDRIGSLGRGKGFMRAGWSDEESAAMRHVEQSALAAGLLSRWDGVGNLVIETPGVFAKWVETGSHMDTVPGGGNYDGAAGVVAGLEAIIAVCRSRPPLERGLRLRVWRCEESSTFGVVSAGARAAFGMLDPDVLEHVYRGETLAQSIAGQGGDPAFIAERRPTVAATERESIAAHIELHIEQGSVLEQGGFDLGVVTGIRGSTRSWVRLTGAFDHSGATPIGPEWRKDVNLGMAYMQVRLDTLATDAIEAGRDIVQTVGVINSNHDFNDAQAALYDNAVSKVSGFGYFSHEVRGCYPAEVRNFVRQAHDVIRQTAGEFGVHVEIEEFSSVNGIFRLDDGLQHLLSACCKKHGASYTGLPSGAWHDVAVLHDQQRDDGSKIPTGMLFVPCRGGVSHSPEEYVSPEQLALGAEVLAEAMAELARRQ